MGGLGGPLTPVKSLLLNYLPVFIFLQVLEVVRSNYDTLTLKLQESLDQYPRYEEKPRETAFFANLVRIFSLDFFSNFHRFEE